MHVAADGLVEQREEAPPRVPLGHRTQHVGEVLDELEDHVLASALLRAPAASRAMIQREPAADPAHRREDG